MAAATFVTSSEGRSHRPLKATLNESRALHVGHMPKDFRAPIEQYRRYKTLVPADSTLS